MRQPFGANYAPFDPTDRGSNGASCKRLVTSCLVAGDEPRFVEPQDQGNQSCWGPSLGAPPGCVSSGLEGPIDEQSPSTQPHPFTIPL